MKIFIFKFGRPLFFEERRQRVEDARLKYNSQPGGQPPAKRKYWKIWVLKAFLLAHKASNADEAQIAFELAPNGSKAKELALQKLTKFSA